MGLKPDSDRSHCQAIPGNPCKCTIGCRLATSTSPSSSKSSRLTVFSLMRSVSRSAPANKYLRGVLKFFSNCLTISCARFDSGTMYGGMSSTRLRRLRTSIMRCLSDAAGMIHNPRSRSNWAGVANRSSPVRTPVSNSRRTANCVTCLARYLCIPDTRIGERHSRTPNPRLDGTEVVAASAGDLRTAIVRYPEYRTDGPKDVPDWMRCGRIPLNVSKAQLRNPLELQDLRGFPKSRAECGALLGAGDGNRTHV